MLRDEGSHMGQWRHVGACFLLLGGFSLPQPGDLTRPTGTHRATEASSHLHQLQVSFGPSEREITLLMGI